MDIPLMNHWSKSDAYTEERYGFWLAIEARKGIPYEYGGIAKAKEFINFTVLGDDEPTGIENLTPASPEGKGVIYNLNGQKVTSIQSGQVYIMNGKKFLAN